MSLANQKELSFDRYLPPIKKKYYLNKGMCIMDGLRKDKLNEYINEIGVEKYIVPCYFLNKDHSRNYTIFYGDVKNFAHKGGRRKASKKLVKDVMEYFFSTINNSDAEVAERFGIARTVATYIISTELKEKFRLLNIKKNK